MEHNGLIGMIKQVRPFPSLPFVLLCLMSLFSLLLSLLLLASSARQRIARLAGGRYLSLRPGGAWHGRPLPLRLRLGGGHPPPPPLFSVPLLRVAFPVVPTYGCCSKNCGLLRLCGARRDLPTRPAGAGAEARESEPDRHSSRARAGEPESHGAEEPKSQPKPEPEY